MNRTELQHILDNAVAKARLDTSGEVATYIPELANVDPHLVSAAIHTIHGGECLSGDHSTHQFTLQSVAKLVVLIGLLEEFGEEMLLSWTQAEPSGQSFASLAQLDRFGPVPANPMVNAGAIALCGRIPGNVQQRAQWLDDWIAKLFGRPLQVNGKVFASERATGDRNRSLAYLMRSTGALILPVEEVLETYFYLCSYEANISAAAYLPMLLANGGKDLKGNTIISETTVCTVVSIMATCGLYDESGIRLVRYGMPAKSGISGLIVAVALGEAGIAVSSPLLNAKVGSVRGHLILEQISRAMHWHFAIPRKL